MRDILADVQEAAAKKIEYTVHATEQMGQHHRRIRHAEVRQVIERGEVIEDYPNARRGHCCLLLGHGENGRPLHVVCAPQPHRLLIITAYPPDPVEWDEEFRRRRSQ